MAEKRLNYSAEQINELLEQVENGDVGGGASPEQLQQIEQNAQAIEELKAGKADKSEIPEVPVKSVNGKTGAVQLSATDVSAEPANAVSSHNTSNASHGDIRLLITELTNRLNAVANSTDVDLDQLAELVAYIKDNRSLIEQVTSNKVNVSDIVNNLTTSASNKPLSAAQGVALKALIDAIKIPDISGKADKSDLTSHTGNTTIHITSTERSTWNNKANKATTLSGYGITDGATKTELNNLSEEIDDLKDRVEAVENSGGGGGTADSVDWEDVQNKPFGYSAEKVLIDNQTLTLEDGGYTSTELSLTAGSFYKLTVNGTLYECTAEEQDYFGSTMVGFGDLGMLTGTPNGNYPFAVAYVTGMFAFTLFDGSTTCTVTLTEQEMKKIPEEYYEASKVTKFYSKALNGYLYNDSSGEGPKVTVNEIKEALKKGTIVISYLDLNFFFPSYIQFAVQGESLHAKIYAYMNSGVTQFYTAEYTG